MTKLTPHNNIYLAHDLFRPSFARRSGLREGGKSGPAFRDHALAGARCRIAGNATGFFMD
jgi:hypothetical protein